MIAATFILGKICDGGSIWVLWLLSVFLTMDKLSPMRHKVNDGDPRGMPLFLKYRMTSETE
jgi:hypothetical protein